METLLEESTKDTKFIANPDGDGVLHPLREPADFAPVYGALEAIDLFKERIEGIVEGDYGDFMRRAQTYFLEMTEEIGPLEKALRPRLRWIEEYLQFLPNWDIDSTRARLLVDIDRLRAEAELDLSA
ncbi:MAG TPA: hypothetical protein VM432_04625 [Bdellovibrionales bacterium]|jgi:hypothetical protein|nr:hypothetical protein [Bdellovibrionales bacterium]